MYVILSQSSPISIGLMLSAAVLGARIRTNCSESITHLLPWEVLPPYWSTIELWLTNPLKGDPDAVFPRYLVPLIWPLEQVAIHILSAIWQGVLHIIPSLGQLHLHSGRYLYVMDNILPEPSPLKSSMTHSSSQKEHPVLPVPEQIHVPGANLQLKRKHY